MCHNITYSNLAQFLHTLTQHLRDDQVLIIARPEADPADFPVAVGEEEASERREEREEGREERRMSEGGSGFIIGGRRRQKQRNEVLIFSKRFTERSK